MHKDFVVPELKLAGAADRIILGLGGAGGDFYGESIVHESEFAADECGANE